MIKEVALVFILISMFITSGTSKPIQMDTMTGPYLIEFTVDDSNKVFTYTFGETKIIGKSDAGEIFTEQSTDLLWLYPTEFKIETRAGVYDSENDYGFVEYQNTRDPIMGWPDQAYLAELFWINARNPDTNEIVKTENGIMCLIDIIRKKHFEGMSQDEIDSWKYFTESDEHFLEMADYDDFMKIGPVKLNNDLGIKTEYINGRPWIITKTNTEGTDGTEDLYIGMSRTIDGDMFWVMVPDCYPEYFNDIIRSIKITVAE